MSTGGDELELELETGEEKEGKKKERGGGESCKMLIASAFGASAVIYAFVALAVWASVPALADSPDEVRLLLLVLFPAVPALLTLISGLVYAFSKCRRGI